MRPETRLRHDLTAALGADRLFWTEAGRGGNTLGLPDATAALAGLAAPVWIELKADHVAASGHWKNNLRPAQNAVNRRVLHLGLGHLAFVVVGDRAGSNCPSMRSVRSCRAPLPCQEGAVVWATPVQRLYSGQEFLPVKAAIVLDRVRLEDLADWLLGQVQRNGPSRGLLLR